MAFIFCRRPSAIALLLFFSISNQAAATGVTRLSGADLQPDAFPAGAYGMVYYQKKDGEWDYFSGYIDAASERSITLRQRGRLPTT